MAFKTLTHTQTLPGGIPAASPEYQAKMRLIASATGNAVGFARGLTIAIGDARWSDPDDDGLFTWENVAPNYPVDENNPQVEVITSPANTRYGITVMRHTGRGWKPIGREIVVSVDDAGGTQDTSEGEDPIPSGLGAFTQGDPGRDGHTILSGTVDPGPSDGANGDFWLNTSTSTLFGPKAAGVWPSGVQLIGPSGDDGSTILYGTAPPGPSDGNDGDSFIDTTAGMFYGPKAAGVWPAGSSMVGPAGLDGSSIRNGTGAPSGGLGDNGDFYIDTAADAIYGPKAAGVWGSATSLIGQPGDDGADGNTVRTGTGAPSNGLGVNGDWYIDSAALKIYGPKAASVWPAGVDLVGPIGGFNAMSIVLAPTGGLISPTLDTFFMNQSGQLVQVVVSTAIGATAVAKAGAQQTMTTNLVINHVAGLEVYDATNSVYLTKGALSRGPGDSGTADATLDLTNVGFFSVSLGDFRVVTAGTNSASVVTVGGTQTLTAKTLTSPTINTPTLNGSGGALTLPAGPDTIAGRATTDTLTNKRVTKRVTSTTGNAPTYNWDNADVLRVTAITATINLGTNLTVGTPTLAETKMVLLTDDGTGRAITWGTNYANGGIFALPTTTVAGVRLGVVLVWNSVTSKFDCAGIF